MNLSPMYSEPSDDQFGLVVEQAGSMKSDASAASFPSSH